MPDVMKSSPSEEPWIEATISDAPTTIWLGAQAVQDRRGTQKELTMSAPRHGQI